MPILLRLADHLRCKLSITTSNSLRCHLPTSLPHRRLLNIQAPTQHHHLLLPLPRLLLLLLLLLLQSPLLPPWLLLPLLLSLFLLLYLPLLLLLLLHLLPRLHPSPWQIIFAAAFQRLLLEPFHQPTHPLMQSIHLDRVLKLNSLRAHDLGRVHRLSSSPPTRLQIPLNRNT